MKKMNIMKKACAILALTVALSLTGCGGGANTDGGSQTSTQAFDAVTFGDKIVASVTFDTDMKVADDSVASAMVKPASDTSKVTLYNGSGSVADELLIIVAADEASAASELEVANQHVETLKNSFKDYLPDEAKKVEHAVVVQNGNVVVVCITNDADNAKTQINAEISK